MHRRHPVPIGEQVVGVVVVVEDHPRATRLEHGEALVGATDGAAPAQHDLAGDLGRIERAGNAQVAPGELGVDERKLRVCHA